VCRVVPGAEGAVGNESDLVQLALGEHVMPVAVGEVEAVLHGCDVGDGSGDGVTLETPMCRIFPSLRRALSAPIDSA
jgi:hypothetical protein